MKNLNRTLLASLAVATLLLTGCTKDATPPGPTSTGSPTPTASSTGDPTDTTSPTGSSVPTPTITADPETGQFEWCNPEKQKPFTGEAADEFGAKKVMEAYCTMVELQMDYSFNDALMRADGGFTKQDFEPLREYLGASAREDWDEAVAKVVSGKPDAGASRTLSGLVSIALVNGSGYVLDVPAVFNQRFSPAEAWVDIADNGEKRLGLKFSVGADLALVREKDDKRMAFNSGKELTYALSEGLPGAQGKDWYIEAFEYEATGDAPVPREELIKGTS